MLFDTADNDMTSKYMTKKPNRNAKIGISLKIRPTANTSVVPAKP